MIKLTTRTVRMFSQTLSTSLHEPIQAKGDQTDLRQNFEDILKLSSKSLSNKTEPKTLVKLIRMCSFIENKHDTQLL